MTEERASVAVVGRSVDAAADAVVELDPARDPETVRTVLAGVAEEGVVTAGAVDDAVGETSLVVATAENRTEFAERALAAARDAAGGAMDVDAVRARLDRFDATLGRIEEDLAAVRTALGDAVNRVGGEATTYAAVCDLREVEANAKAVQRAADELQVALDEFERWVGDPAVRVDELRGDVDALDAAVEGLSAAVEAVPAADDRGAAWADARLRTAAYDLLLADLRAERAALRSWPDEEPPDGLDGIGDRLDGLDGRLASVRGRLDDARPGWRERHGGIVEAFERELDGRDPPVDWGEVRAVLDERREAVGDASAGRPSGA